MLSGGIIDTDVKVWDSETGKNVASLKGHKGGINSIKMTNDGSVAFSVGSDKFIQLWDVRVRASIGEINGTKFREMNDIAFAPSLSTGVDNKALNGLACVAHTDGMLTFWDMNMR